MGASKSKSKHETFHHVELNEDIVKLATEIFKEMDEDGSDTVTKIEAIKYWATNYAKINADEFFNTVDLNNDDSITFEEWIDFWREVKSKGHSDDEILEEVSLSNLSCKD